MWMYDFCGDIWGYMILDDHQNVNFRKLMIMWWKKLGKPLVPVLRMICWHPFNYGSVGGWCFFLLDLLVNNDVGLLTIKIFGYCWCVNILWDYAIQYIENYQHP